MSWSRARRLQCPGESFLIRAGLSRARLSPPLKRLFAPQPKASAASAAERRVELDRLVALFRGEIRVCPPETTSAAMNPRMGRPPLNDRVMTAAERQRRYRQRKRAQGLSKSKSPR